MTLSEGTLPQEKYLIMATHYQILGDTPKAIDAYANLAKAWPNTPRCCRLGELYEAPTTRRPAKIRDVVKLDPKFKRDCSPGRVEIDGRVSYREAGDEARRWPSNSATGGEGQSSS